MKKKIYLFMMMFTMATIFTSCRETENKNKAEEVIDDVGDEIEDAGDEIEDATDDF